MAIAKSLTDTQHGVLEPYAIITYPSWYFFDEWIFFPEQFFNKKIENQKK